MQSKGAGQKEAMAGRRRILETNREAIDDAREVQDETKDALRRMQGQAAEAEESGMTTLAEMRRQREQLYGLDDAADHLNEELKRGQNLQNRLDRWAGRWGGRTKQNAKKEAKKVLETQGVQDERRAALKPKEIVVEEPETDDAVIITPKRRKKKMLARGRSLNKEGQFAVTTSSRDVMTSHFDMSQYDDEEQEGLRRLEENDQEIDSMLDETGKAISRLKVLGTHLKDETEEQSGQIDTIQEKMDRATGKQSQINSRVRGALQGRWLKRAQSERFDSSGNNRGSMTVGAFSRSARNLVKDIK